MDKEERTPGCIIGELAALYAMSLARAMERPLTEELATGLSKLMSKLTWELCEAVGGDPGDMERAFDAKIAQVEQEVVKQIFAQMRPSEPH